MSEYTRNLVVAILGMVGLLSIGACTWLHANGTADTGGVCQIATVCVGGLLGLLGGNQPKQQP